MFVDSLDLLRVFYIYSESVWVCDLYYVDAKENLKSDALHNTTVISRESSTIDLDWKTWLKNLKTNFHMTGLIIRCFYFFTLEFSAHY